MIKKRILQIIENEKIEKKIFFEKFSISYSNFKGKHLNSSLSSDILVKIITEYPNIDLNWLIMGQGSMYKNEAPPVVEQKPCEECKAHKQTIQNLNDTIYMYREKLQVCEQKRETSSRIIPQEKTPL